MGILFNFIIHKTLLLLANRPEITILKEVTYLILAQACPNHEVTNITKMLISKNVINRDLNHHSKFILLKYVVR